MKSIIIIIYYFITQVFAKKNCSGNGYSQFNKRAHLDECICDLLHTGQNCEMAIPLAPIILHLTSGSFAFLSIILAYYFCFKKRASSKKLVIYDENMAFSRFLFENKRVGKVDHVEFANQTIKIEKEKMATEYNENGDKIGGAAVHDDDLGSTINTVVSTKQDTTKF
ncbi:unnamed protein product [Caenorhabditis angaria]|uniref:EGF-like domain-containing protein n=1 Tax=Caenorhabditis angaria TaxID=860376 RepID=A0A9P1I6V0_9PELO|nr:unnamed protein product [Caenorhabditis angaria]